MPAPRGSNGQMRVLFAHPEPIDPSRARWVAILRTLAAVAERVDVTWLTPDSRADVEDYAHSHLGMALPPGLAIETLRSARRRMGLITLNRVFFRAFRKAVAGRDADVLWLRSDKLAAYAAHRLESPPLVYEAHLVGELYARDKGAPERRARRLFELERDIYARAQGVAAISKGLLDEIRTGFAYSGPAEVVPSAVDTGVFQPVWKGGDGRTVVYVGTQQSWKGIETLLEAVARTELRLRVVGDGGEITARARAVGVADRLEVTGRVPQGEIPALVAGAAVAVHPLPPGQSISARFTSPLKVFEYMAMGLPVVAADVPSVREILADGRNARLYAAGEVDALAAALKEVATDGALAGRLSRAARDDAEGHTYGKRAERLLGLMEAAARVS